MSNAIPRFEKNAAELRRLGKTAPDRRRRKAIQRLLSPVQVTKKKALPFERAPGCNKLFSCHSEPVSQVWYGQRDPFSQSSKLIRVVRRCGLPLRWHRSRAEIGSSRASQCVTMSAMTTFVYRLTVDSLRPRVNSEASMPNTFPNPAAQPLPAGRSPSPAQCAPSPHTPAFSAPGQSPLPS